MNRICAIVLAAGRGTRMRPLAGEGLSKVLHLVLGRPIICYTAKLLEELAIPSYFVVGFGADKVKKVLAGFKNIQFVEQKKQLGTAHAAQLALKKIPREKYQAVLVLHGDSSAFFQPNTIQALVDKHFKQKAKLSVLTLKKKESDGSGVLLRNSEGQILGNAETKEKTYYNCEVNVGAFVYDLAWLKKTLPKIKPQKVNQEYYLTDSINIAGSQKDKIVTALLRNSWEKVHINTPAQLKNAQELAQKHLAESDKLKIAVVGLGYVGLPLAVEFSQAGVPVIGFDIDSQKINQLKQGKDPSREVDSQTLRRTKIEYTTDPKSLSRANFIIVTVPTPITKAKQPDLSLIRSASKIVGQNLRKGSVVVFESTVYPGVTEEICLPILEKESGLKAGIDFKIGYSPERINPGDKEHTIDKIVKVVAGMDKKALDMIARVYSLICKAGVYKAENIKTAEAAKVIENTQRDLNIALMNELSLIFGKMGIRTKSVLEAAGTKWNFHQYYPGLVGGHCIGVDPYYLAYNAEQLGCHPQVILAGRRVNDSMSEYVADLMIKGLIEAGKRIEGAKVLVLGLTFKENVADTRNSKIKDTVSRLREYKIEVFGFDPMITKQKAIKFGANPLTGYQKIKLDGIILNVVHDQFKQLSLKDIIGMSAKSPVLIDLKSFFKRDQAQSKGIIYKSL